MLERRRIELYLNLFILTMNVQRQVSLRTLSVYMQLCKCFPDDVIIRCKLVIMTPKCIRRMDVGPPSMKY